MISQKYKEMWIELIPWLIFCVFMAGFTALFLVIVERKERRKLINDQKKV